MTPPRTHSATPEMIAAAWKAWHARHGGKLGPGPAFAEAVEAVYPLIYAKAIEDAAGVVDGFAAPFAVHTASGAVLFRTNCEKIATAIRALAGEAEG